ncbi:uncharacterized protein LOC126328073 [Schistocerca gregaria]|uniref:uncharacterized protein LOC126328073 n=1 Tax=Schistocerca gregaria TaxID=7010 RepID=UPI00211EB4C0|nr:uncharacterized protein LOC126328073 [Schistocerca gregaria]
MSEATRWLAEAAQKALSMDADRARAVAECVQGLKDERDVVESLEVRGVSCEREGEGRKCGHCGGEVRRSGEVEGARDDAKLKRARGDLRRLLQYDREAAERMLVYDDQSDYFDMSSGWLTKSERRAIQESELGLGRESTRVRENIERGEEAFKAESRRFLQGSSDARHKVKLMPRPVEAEPPRIDAPWNRPIHLDCDDTTTTSRTWTSTSSNPTHPRGLPHPCTA